MAEEKKKVDLEQHFILRLPEKEAERVRKNMRLGKKKLDLKILMDDETSTGTVEVGKKILHGVMKKLPTHVESYKTNLGGDNALAFKTADLCGLFDCSKSDPNLKPVKPPGHPHGITPPMKNVKKKKFRKTLVNPEEAKKAEEVLKELYYLMRTDLEATSTRFVVVDQENGTELSLFGKVSESGSSDSSLSP